MEEERAVELVARAEEKSRRVKRGRVRSARGESRQKKRTERGER